MADTVALQLDVGNLATGALGMWGPFRQALEAVSADSVDPIATTQAVALGSCFHMNGKWAEEIPDLLARHPSQRLGRLGVVIGWRKGDTASYLRETAGGQAASLICLILSNMYPMEKCGIILQDISARLIAKDQCKANIAAFNGLTAYLAGKLSCLGFGNVLGTQVTNIRQCLFEVGQKAPEDLVSIPSEETMKEFLFQLHKALQHEELILYFTGWRGAGYFVAFVICLCPADVQVIVNGEAIHKGERTSIIFSITVNGCQRDQSAPETSREGGQSSFYLESKLRAQSDDFRKHHVAVSEVTDFPDVKYQWAGWLSSSLSIALAKVGAGHQTDVSQALANLIAATALCLGGDSPRLPKESIGYTKGRLPANGMEGLLGSGCESSIYETLRLLLVAPTNTATYFDSLDDRPHWRYPTVKDSYTELRNAVAAIVPIDLCTCDDCIGREPWDLEGTKPLINSERFRKWHACLHACLWAELGDIVTKGIVCSLVTVVGNAAVSPVRLPGEQKILAKIVKSSDRKSTIEYSASLTVSYIHNEILSLVGSRIGSSNTQPLCQSSSFATIFPSTLEHPTARSPRLIKYVLAEGRLREGANVYSGIICTTNHNNSVRKLGRQTASKSIPSNDKRIIPSDLGQHRAFEMTLRPDFIGGHNSVLLLRSSIAVSQTRNIEVNFLELHLGFMSLTSARPCEHSPEDPLEDQKAFRTVITTSVAEPVPKSKDKVSLTLTHWNPEAQFLCCSYDIPTLYQANCCLSCVVKQAHKGRWTMIIGNAYPA